MKRTPIFIFLGLLASSLEPSLAAERSTGVFPGRDWQEASPESQGINASKLNEAMQYLGSVLSDGQDLSQALVIRNGYLIWKGPDIDNSHWVASCTKEFASTVLGLLTDDGKCSPNNFVKDFVPDLGAMYGSVRLRHFATHSSGYDARGGEQSETPFAVAEPLFPPGTKFQYWDSAMNQFGRILTRIAGEPMKDLFKRRIADPIGMNPAKWSWADWGRVDGLLVNGAAGNRARGVTVSARELARLGHLFLNRGNWNGRQLLSAAFVYQATSVEISAAIPMHKPDAYGGPGLVGFNWWLNGIRPDGKRRWPDAPPRTFEAAGYKNNRMWIVPEWAMVIVCLSTEGVWTTDDKVSAFFKRVENAVNQQGAAGQRVSHPSAAAGIVLGIDGAAFTINGKKTFLLGASYYGALGAPDDFIARDLDDLRTLGFNWIRVWAVWDMFDHNVSAVDITGKTREPYLAKLKAVVTAAEKRGMVVDVTLARMPGLTNQEAHLRAAETLAKALKGRRNVYFDLANERDQNYAGGTFVSYAELRALRDRVKAADSDRLVTASGEPTDRADLARYLVEAGLDFISPHLARNARTERRTADATRKHLEWMKELGRAVPVHYQEPFRRDYLDYRGFWQPEVETFCTDLRNAKLGGAAGWCFHNGSPSPPERFPAGKRRSFDMRPSQGRLMDQLDEVERQFLKRAVSCVQ